MKFVCIYLDNCYAQQSLSFEAEALERAVVGLPARCRGRIGLGPDVKREDIYVTPVWLIEEDLSVHRLAYKSDEVTEEAVAMDIPGDYNIINLDYGFVSDWLNRSEQKITGEN